MTQWEVYRTRLESNRYGSVSGALRAAKMMKLKPYDDAVKLVEAWFAEPRPVPDKKGKKVMPVEVNGVAPGVGVALMSVLSNTAARVLLRNYFSAFAREGVPHEVAARMLEGALTDKG